MNLQAYVPWRMRRWWQNAFSPNDRRCAERVPFRQEIEVRKESGVLCRGLARDLSDKGMGAIVFGQDLEQGEQVWIKYNHPRAGRSQLIVRRAIVRSNYGFRYGFEFEHSLDHERRES